MNILELLKSKISTIYVKYLNNEEIENLPIFYIAGSQKLPPPLSSDEEEELLIKLENKDLEARQILVERNLRLVVYIAKKIRKYRCRNRRFNINWNNRINESNKYI